MRVMKKPPKFEVIEGGKSESFEDRHIEDTTRGVESPESDIESAYTPEQAVEKAHQGFIAKHRAKIEAVAMVAAAAGIGVVGGQQIMQWLQESDPGSMRTMTIGAQALFGAITMSTVGTLSGMAMNKIRNKFTDRRAREELNQKQREEFRRNYTA